jgi:hypothetical protein
MEVFPVTPGTARERAAATRDRSATLRVQLAWTTAVARREIRRARHLLAAAEAAVGLNLPWQEPDLELESVLVVLDGGLTSLPTNGPA